MLSVYDECGVGMASEHFIFLGYLRLCALNDMKLLCCTNPYIIICIVKHAN